MECGFPGGSVVKSLPANAGDTGGTGSIPGWGRSPREGNGNPLLYSCLENPIDREVGYSPWGLKELDMTEWLSMHAGEWKRIGFIIGKEVKSLSHVWTLCDPIDYSPQGSSVHGILQARVLEWVAISFSRGSSWPRDRTQVSCIVGRRFTVWATIIGNHL